MLIYSLPLWYYKWSVKWNGRTPNFASDSVYVYIVKFYFHEIAEPPIPQEHVFYPNSMDSVEFTMWVLWKWLPIDLECLW